MEVTHRSKMILKSLTGIGWRFLPFFIEVHDLTLDFQYFFQSRDDGIVYVLSRLVRHRKGMGRIDERWDVVLA